MIFSWISIICFLLVNKSQAMPETATWPDTWPTWMKCYGRGLGKRVCAQLFDSEDCRQGMWGRDGYEVRDKGGEMETLPKRFQFDTESLIVKAGCTLYAYSDPLCRIFPGKLFHKFVADKRNDLIIIELEDSLAYKIDEKIACVKCKCNH